MFYREKLNFKDMVAADFGLKGNDKDTHSPQFLMLLKTTETATHGKAFRDIFRGRSDIGIAKDKERRRTKRYEQKKAKAAAKASESEESAHPTTASKTSPSVSAPSAPPAPSARSSWE